MFILILSICIYLSGLQFTAKTHLQRSIRTDIFSLFCEYTLEFCACNNFWRYWLKLYRELDFTDMNNITVKI